MNGRPPEQVDALPTQVGDNCALVSNLLSVNGQTAPYANETVRQWCHQAAEVIAHLTLERDEASKVPDGWELKPKPPTVTRLRDYLSDHGWSIEAYPHLDGFWMEGIQIVMPRANDSADSERWVEFALRTLSQMRGLTTEAIMRELAPPLPVSLGASA